MYYFNYLLLKEKSKNKRIMWKIKEIIEGYDIENTIRNDNDNKTRLTIEL
jgi:hypothetical protein